MNGIPSEQVPVAWLVHADNPYATTEPPVDGGLPRTPLYTRLQHPADALTDERIVALAELAHWVLSEGSFAGCDIDGGSLQDKAAALGIIHPVKVTEPCNDHSCACADFGLPATCYRFAPWLEAFRAAAQGVK